jgi:hypothetical protein
MGDIPVATSGRRALVNLTLAVAGMVVALGTLEVGLRVLDVDVASCHAIGGFTTYDRELGWRLAPSRETVFRGAHFSVAVSHNAEGLRDRHYPYEGEAGRRRILVLGDSVVWCWGVEQADCFTERIEAALRDTDVINTGVPAWSTAQELLFYEREGRRYGADLVLLVAVPNDPWENVAGPGPRFKLDGDKLIETNVPVPRRKGHATEWLQAHSRLFAHVNYLVAVMKRALGNLAVAGRKLVASVVPVGAERSNPQRTFVPAAPPPGDRSYAVTEALLDRLAEDVRHDGARFVLVLEAMPKIMARRLREFSAARGIPCVELGPALAAAQAQGEQVRLKGDPHIAPAGQQVVATTILASLDREGLLGDGGRPPAY